MTGGEWDIGNDPTRAPPASPPLPAARCAARATAYLQRTWTPRRSWRRGRRTLPAHHTGNVDGLD